MKGVKCQVYWDSQVSLVYMKEQMKMGITVSLMDELNPCSDQRSIKIIVWQVSPSGTISSIVESNFQESVRQKLALGKEKCLKLSDSPEEDSFIIQIKKIHWVKRSKDSSHSTWHLFMIFTNLLSMAVLTCTAMPIMMKMGKIIQMMMILMKRIIKFSLRWGSWFSSRGFFKCQWGWEEALDRGTSVPRHPLY